MTSLRNVRLRGLALLLAAVAASPAAADVWGDPYVIDGDSLEIDGERVRLNGVDAVEGPQECQDTNGRDWACGRAAASALSDFLEASLPIYCEEVDVDQYGRIIAICWRDDGTEVNAWMVAKGWALDYARHSGGAYAKLERAAQADGLGIWAGTFTPPEEWRQVNMDRRD